MANNLLRHFHRLEGDPGQLTLGSDLQAAKDGLAIRLADNVNRVDFDAQKEKASEQGMTVAAWSKSYVQLEEVMKQRALNRAPDCIAAINRHIGDMLLTDGTREHLFRYRNERLQEHIIRCGKPAAKTISGRHRGEWSFPV